MTNEVFDRYLTRLERRGRDVKTVLNARRAFEVADAWIEAQGLDPLNLTIEDGEDWIAHLLERYSVGTCRHHLVNVRAAYTYALRRGQVSCDPTVEIELPADNRGKPRIYSVQELRSIYAEIAADRENLIFHLLAYAGIRRIECIRLRWEDIDFQRQEMTVFGKRTKGHERPRVVPAEVLVRARETKRDGQVYVIESDWTNGNSKCRSNEPISTPAFATAIRKLIDRAGIETAQPCHTFRKTAVSNLERQGVAGNVLDELFGWSARSIRARHYSLVADRSMHEAISRLYIDDPLNG